MHRRELFRLIAAGAAFPALNSPTLAMLREVQSTPSYTPRTLDPHQNATVVAMTDIILPATETPGAKGAKVNEFIDVILTDWATAPERQNFLSGLGNVDERSITLFGKPFVDASTAQQEVLLRAMDDEWVRLESVPKPRTTAYQKRDQQLKDPFFGVFKRLTLVGYYTSEIGFSQELKKEIIPGSYHGCQPIGTKNA
ncbi:MAG: gluconate 2-dehydrogenase subunit 3 family protein [Candidatus Acidiferrum sp.]